MSSGFSNWLMAESCSSDSCVGGSFAMWNTPVTHLGLFVRPSDFISRHCGIIFAALFLVSPNADVHTRWCVIVIGAQSRIEKK